MLNTRLIFLVGSLVLAAPLSAHGQISNEVLGSGAGASLTTGDYNVFVGDYSGQTVDTGSRNAFYGMGAGRWQEIRNEIVCIGFGACSGTTLLETLVDPFAAAPISPPGGFNNTFVGTFAGALNRGSDGTFIGHRAGWQNTTGPDNTFVGADAGYSNTTGRDNTFVGEGAGYSNTTGSFNTAIGTNAGSQATTAWHNTTVGYQAGYDMGVAECNTMLGSFSGTFTEHADFNTFVGFLSGGDNNRTDDTASGNRNTYLGAFAGLSNREGQGNVMIGALADSSVISLTDLSTSCASTAAVYPGRGDINNTVNNLTLVGSQAYGSGNNSTAIGHAASVTADNGIAIGANATVTSGHTNAIVIGHTTTSHASNIGVLGGGVTAWHPDVDGGADFGATTFRWSTIFGQALTALAAVGTDAVISMEADNGTDADDRWQITAANSGNLNIASFASGAYVNVVSVDNTGNMHVAGDITMTSDSRLKNNITTIRKALNTLAKVRGVSFNWKPETQRDGEVHYGLLAQEVQKVAPELVKRDSAGHLAVNYNGLVPLLVNAVKELDQKVETQNRLLREQNALLREQLEAARRVSGQRR